MVTRSMTTISPLLYHGYKLLITFTAKTAVLVFFLFFRELIEH
jgi:hypothetical protein